MIQCKRIYQPPAVDDGRRVLVDRLWPRGLAKDSLQLDAWTVGVAPSNALRKHFHQEQDFVAFQQAYRQELNTNPEHWQPLLHWASEGTLTLLYSARDEEQNNARVLADFLEDELERQGSPSSPTCYQEEFKTRV